MVIPFLEQKFLGNRIEDYIWFLIIILIGLVLQKFLSKVLTRLIFRALKRYSGSTIGFDKLLPLLKKPLSIFILLIAVYLAFDRLTFPPYWELASKDKFGIRMILFKSFQTSIIFTFTWIILRIVDFFGLVFLYKASLTESKADDQLVPFVKEFVKILIFIFSVFFILGSVFDLNITSLIAGLGIGGLAIALAAKESLENLLGSFTIFLDKPFVVGDFIKVGQTQGHVEKIGFRSTRIRTLDKTYVTVPNKKMVEGELDNITLRTFRRARFDVNLKYDTPLQTVQAIVSELDQYLTSNRALMDGQSRVKLNDLGPTAIVIMILYFVDTIDDDVYLNVRQEINFKIMEVVTKHKAEFALPVIKV